MKFVSGNHDMIVIVLTFHRIQRATIKYFTFNTK